MTIPNTSEAHIELDNRQQTTLTQTNANSASAQYDGITNVDEDAIVAQSLKPADGGLAAWRLLISAFVFEALLWGKDQVHHLRPLFIPGANTI